MSDWGGTLYVKSADTAPALMDLVPDAQGIVSGSVDLRIHLAGNTRRTSMLNGDGSIEIRNGEVSGFSGAAAVSKLLGGKPLRFDALNASFSVDGKNIYLLPGSRVAAPKADPVFKYIMADGSISMEKDVNLFCVGNVNIRALNSFVGGMRGLVSSAMDQGTSGLTFQNFLGGAITGLTKDEFRDVSLSVIASSSDVSFGKITIAEPAKNDLSPALNEAEQRREKNDEMLRLNLEFPVGPGGDEHSSGIGSQIGGQVLEHALNGLLSF
jgi:translocation and assembly module TamB